MKPIRTPQDHQAALDEIGSLMGAPPGTAGADRLEILAVLVSEYERRAIVEEQEPDPVEVLGLVMRGKGLSQAALAEVIGSRARASEVLSRKRSLSAEMVERLSLAWSIPIRLLNGRNRVEPRPSRIGKAMSLLMLVLAFAAAGIASPFLIYGRDLPDVAPLLAQARQGSTMSGLPPHVSQAFIAMEDQRFLSHRGYDPAALGRALLRNVASGGGRPAGGATLTQQLVKNGLLKGEPPSLRRKVREILLARRVEQRLDKDQILDLSLRKVYFGNGAFGLEAAARRYFARPARELSVAQSAYLASLVDAPNARRFDRPGNQERALAARTQALRRMVHAGYLTPELGRAASREQLW